VGTWGPGIFDNDLAADIRGDWESALADGKTFDQALKGIAEAYLTDAATMEEEPNFWFAVALLELDARGTVNDYSRDVSLDLVPHDLAKWRDEGDAESYAAREKVVNDLAERLRSAKITRYPLD
jgi:hypothetical protein